MIDKSSHWLTIIKRHIRFGRIPLSHPNRRKPFKDTLSSAKIGIVFFLLVFVYISHCFAQTSVVSWNLKDFGHSKTNNQITLIASILASYDIVAIQEVVAGPAGLETIVRLVVELSKKGTHWDYQISEVTSGTSAHKAERYAFLWKKPKAKIIGKGWLERRYADSIEREPFYLRFKVAGKTFTLVNFHAITKSQQPEREIKFFKFLPGEYPNDDLIFCGDFNIPQTHSVFNPLRKSGYQPALIGQKTSLRQRCLNGDCLASAFDNFYFLSSKIRLRAAGLIHFYRRFESIKEARKLSDHVPVFINFD